LLSYCFFSQLHYTGICGGMHYFFAKNNAEVVTTPTFIIQPKFRLLFFCCFIGFCWKQAKVVLHIPSKNAILYERMVLYELILYDGLIKGGTCYGICEKNVGGN
ncbi:MAG: hypothetical protein R3Y53_10480, partial [Bacillota bacterium]